MECKVEKTHLSPFGPFEIEEVELRLACNALLIGCTCPANPLAQPVPHTAR
jgi:hypothetical protein